MKRHVPAISTDFRHRYNDRLDEVKIGIDSLIADLRADTSKENAHVRAVLERFISLLERGGKRMRGVMTVVGYECLGGNDRSVIRITAAVMEALHAYLLVGDDVADAADLRRGNPAVHIQLAEYFRTHGDSIHDPAKTGADAAQLIALYAQHKVQASILKMPVADSVKIRALLALNNELARTNLGQTLDVVIAACPNTTMVDTERVALYKTAYYSYLLPIQLGLAIGGGSEQDLANFTDYALHAGFAFQLRDDLMGIYGDVTVTGKSQKSDIIEGKRTLLMQDALAHASVTQKRILQESMGNADLTDEAFVRCLRAIEETGAKVRVTALIGKHTHQAAEALDRLSGNYPAEQLALLKDIAIFGAQRES